MSTLRLRPTNVTPPDKYRFIHPEDGHPTYAYDHSQWLRDIVKYRSDNGYDVPPNMREIAEDQICRTLDGEWCEYSGEGERPAPLNRRVNLDTIIGGTKVFIELVKQGAPLVSKEEATQRALTCSRCYALDKVAGCGSCTGLAEYIVEVAGAQKTPHDDLLAGKSCLICKCAAQANVWVPVEISKVSVTPEMMKQWPSHCWKGNLLKELDNQPA